MSGPIFECQALLNSLSITDFELLHHESAPSVDSHKSILAKHSLIGIQCKNLFLKDKKTKKQFLVTLPVESTINLKNLSKMLNVTELRFDESLSATLKTERGHLSPLAILNDQTHQITIVFDKSFESGDNKLLIHPFINTATLSIKASDVLKVVQKAGNPVVFINSLSSSSSVNEALESKPKVDSQLNQKRGSAIQNQSKNQEGIQYDKFKNFADWYVQIVTRSEMIDYSDISGCYILRPWSYAIWEFIQSFFDGEIKKLNVQNSYFPMFVTKGALEREADHIQGFAPEVAWVTKSGDSDLVEPIAVRPTSETIMYPSFAKWIRSHRDLPLKLNQWCNVVRWEFKCPTPFIRSREFLWQEGHTAHATKQEAEIEVRQILDLYARVYEELLAVPVVKGMKTETEKFAGGLYTTTVEAYIPANGRGIQGATSHCLGQNFAKMFDITFESTKGNKENVWQNSWGLTTRTIGVMIMIHADNFGLVLPPRVAPIQVIIIPIQFAKDESNVIEKANEIHQQLTAIGIRCRVDDRSLYTPGWKYAHWELKGVSLRLELGPKDMASGTCQVHRRDLRDKSKVITLNFCELTRQIPIILSIMQSEMYTRAKEAMDSRRTKVSNWLEFMAALEKRNTVLAPHCQNEECEKQIKKRSGDESKEEVSDITTANEAEHETGEKLTGAAKSLCMPFEAEKPVEGTKCVNCGNKAVNYTLFGRSY